MQANVYLCTFSKMLYINTAIGTHELLGDKKDRQCPEPGKMEGFPGSPLRVLEDYFLQPSLCSSTMQFNLINAYFGPSLCLTNNYEKQGDEQEN